MRINIVLASIFLLVAAEAQNDPPGYMSIRCGLVNKKSYHDSDTGLTYVTDVGLIDTGESRDIPQYKQYYPLYSTIRIFPKGTRNCYTLKPLGGKGTRYLIRATFRHGDYDGSNYTYNFDLHLGPELWETITGEEIGYKRSREIIHTLSSDSLSICLVKTGKTIPFISLLELRPFNNTPYTRSTSLKVVDRTNFFTSYDRPKNFRYPEDIYDRIWDSSYSRLLPTETSSIIERNLYQIPSAVTSTAWVLNTADSSLFYDWDAESEFHVYYVYLHFAELEILSYTELRKFNLYLNGYLWENNGPFSPSYLSTKTLTNAEYIHGSKSYFLQLYPSSDSTENPIINAAELYVVKNFTETETYYQDVEALSNIKTTYGIVKNWQGDPCAPKAFIWNGVDCTYGAVQQIIHLNLSKSELVGPINSAISSLSVLQTLDLSFNRLTGNVPDFLGQLDKLKVIDLTGNSFSGTIPQNLIKKSKAGELTLRFDEKNRPTGGAEGTEKIKLTILIAAGAGVLLVLGVLIAICIICIRRKKKKVSGVDKDTEMKIEDVVVDTEVSNEDLAENEKQSVKAEIKTEHVVVNKDIFVKAKNLEFTYDEIVAITNNFETVLGEGGFGKVYHGYLGEIEVAVKMLSESSNQGPKEFQSEANILMSIHHKNLTPFVGYCCDMSKMGLIYEYMENGTLERHLFGNIALSWLQRLQIAIDAAQGLEYLHHLCKESIVHRDIKTTNILLDGKFQAKIADFGLSRAFPVGGATHLTTMVAGTLGYLDPEYFSTGRITEKSDVYSVGVVLLELITGRQASPKNKDQTHIVSWVSSELDTGDILKIVDRRLNNEEFSVNSGWRYLELAIACVARNSNRRPTMINVVAELQECMTLQCQISDHHEFDHSSTSIATSQSSIRTASLPKMDTEHFPQPR